MVIDVEEYSREEFSRQYARIARGLVRGVVPEKQPRAYLLGGQSGAGKTRLQKLLIEKYGENFIVINGDEYRNAHPRFKIIHEAYGIDAPAHTAKWAGAMVEALVDSLSNERYSLIIEGTLRTSSVPLKTAALLNERGYRVSLALMAVKSEISLISCQIRYEQMRIAGTTPRAVDLAHHSKIVEEIASNLAELETGSAFRDVSLYNRAGECLFAAKCPSVDAAASQALADVLFGDWTEDERRHYSDLQRILKESKEAADRAEQEQS